MKKRVREAAFKKTDGYCYLCGDEITIDNCHIDHKVPLMRNYGLSKKETERLNHIDNLFPACRPCNLLKATFSIEDFRHQLSMQVKRGRKQSINFRTAERFKLITINQNPIKFWFRR